MTTTLTAPPAPTGTAPAARRRPLRLRTSHLLIAVWLVGMLVLPWVVTSDKWMSIAVFTLIASIGALGIQVVMGFAGQLSVGHAAFLAVGAYTSIWLGAQHGQPWWISLPVATLVSGVFGAIIAPTAVRIRGFYLAVATIALVFIMAYVWDTWTSLTGGANGTQAAPVVIGGQNLLDGIWSGNTEVLTMYQAWWYFVLAFLLIACVVTWNIRRSRLGRAFMAVRDRDLAAGVAGIPVTSTKVIAFAISSAYAGLCGALLASFVGFASSTQWTLTMSVDFLAMATIGGLGTISGAILGALFVKAMPELVAWAATFVPFISADAKVDGGITAPLLGQFLYGLAIVLILLFEPHGLTAMFRRPFVALAARRKKVSP